MHTVMYFVRFTLFKYLENVLLLLLHLDLLSTFTISDVSAEWFGDSFNDYTAKIVRSSDVRCWNNKGSRD